MKAGMQLYKNILFYSLIVQAVILQCMFKINSARTIPFPVFILFRAGLHSQGAIAGNAGLPVSGFHKR